jgi:hypothetical protein
LPQMLEDSWALLGGIIRCINDKFFFEKKTQ